MYKLCNWYYGVQQTRSLTKSSCESKFIREIKPLMVTVSLISQGGFEADTAEMELWEPVR